MRSLCDRAAVPLADGNGCPGNMEGNCVNVSFECGFYEINRGVKGGWSVLANVSLPYNLQWGAFPFNILLQSLNLNTSLECSGGLCFSIRGLGSPGAQTHRTKAAPPLGMMHTTCRVRVSGLRGLPTRSGERPLKRNGGGGVNGWPKSKYLCSRHLNNTNQLMPGNDLLHLHVCRLNPGLFLF